MSKKLFLPPGTKIPDHIAIILDGNGRWARSRGLATTRGHEHGARALREVMDSARKLGVHTSTVWAFSTENWKRPPTERAKIFALIKNYLEEEIKTAHKNHIRFVHIGRRDRLPSELMKLIKRAESETENYTKHILNLALDYGGREEILMATKNIVKDGVEPKEITQKLFESYLYTANQPYPNPDLFIRTSGEQRTSGYLPWQMVYTELYFADCHLPDFTPAKLKEAILDYSRRRRRYGAKDKIKHLTFKPEVVADLELNWWRLSRVPAGERFRDFAVDYLKEQYGMSKEHAVRAAKCFILATINQDKKDWKKSKYHLKSFYTLIKDHLKLAFEPEIVANLKVKFWQAPSDETATNLHAEEYRISSFQATKPAHLRVLAFQSAQKQNWPEAKNYLIKYYRALKDRVA